MLSAKGVCMFYTFSDYFLLNPVIRLWFTIAIRGIGILIAGLSSVVRLLNRVNFDLAHGPRAKLHLCPSNLVQPPLLCTCDVPASSRLMILSLTFYRGF